MAEMLDPKEMVTLGEILFNNEITQEAINNLLEREGNKCLPSMTK